MRALFAGVVVLGMSTGACALIAGLDSYEGGPAGGGDSSLTSVLRDGSPVISDDSSTDPPPAEAGATDDGDVLDPDGSVSESDAGLSPDVNTACDKTTCAGCCMGGQCYGGGSVATCGAGGVSCTDCTDMGGACSSVGKCETKVADAAPPPTCTATKCTGCIPFYQTGCCKSDETCGCKVQIGGNGACN
jgi:hypothetical protein